MHVAGSRATRKLSTCFTTSEDRGLNRDKVEVEGTSQQLCKRCKGMHTYLRKMYCLCCASFRPMASPWMSFKRVEGTDSSPLITEGRDQGWETWPKPQRNLRKHGKDSSPTNFGLCVTPRGYKQDKRRKYRPSAAVFGVRSPWFTRR